MSIFACLHRDKRVNPKKGCEIGEISRTSDIQALFREGIQNDNFSAGSIFLSPRSTNNYYTTEKNKNATLFLKNLFLHRNGLFQAGNIRKTA